MEPARSHQLAIYKNWRHNLLGIFQIPYSLGILKVDLLALGYWQLMYLIQAFFNTARRKN